MISSHPSTLFSMKPPLADAVISSEGFLLLSPSLSGLLLLAVTGSLTGLIWMVQLVHYPLLERLAHQLEFPSLHKFHTSAIGPLVGPLMILEVILSIAVLRDATTLFNVAALAPLAVIWITTAYAALLHHKMERTPELAIAVTRRLTRLNWIRTVCWTGRLGLLIWAMA